MLSVTQLIGFMAGGEESPAQFIYKGSDTQEPNQSSYTYNAKDIGTASSDRVVIVGITAHDGSGSKDITSVTIGGVSATKLSNGDDASGVCSCDVWAAVVPSGTTADIVFNLATSATKSAIVWGVAYGLRDQLTPVDTLVVNTASTSPLAGNIDVSAGGFVFGIVTVQNTVATYTMSGVSEDSDQTIGTSNGSYGAGHYGGDISSPVAAETNRAISISISAAQTRQCINFVSMR